MRGLSLKQERFIAAYLGPARGNATEAARQAGYKGNAETLAEVGRQNLGKPGIAAVLATARAVIRAEGIANKQNRIDRLNDDWRRMQTLRDARAEAGKARRVREEQAVLSPEDVAAGTETGLLVRQEKPTLHGTIVEYAFDRALLAELRAHEEQAAKELGQWTEKRELSADEGFLDALRAFGAGTP